VVDQNYILFAARSSLSWTFYLYRRPPAGAELVKGLFGKLSGDKGYVSRPLFAALYDEGVRLVTKLKRGMRNRLLPFFDNSQLFSSSA
jgi:hypothetical protein